MNLILPLHCFTFPSVSRSQNKVPTEIQTLLCELQASCQCDYVVFSATVNGFMASTIPMLPHHLVLKSHSAKCCNNFSVK